MNARWTSSNTKQVPRKTLPRNKSNWFTTGELCSMADLNQHEHLEAVCLAVKDHLQELAVKRCNGTISEEQFIDAVLRIEAQEVTPKGLTLTASNTRDEWTVFRIKINGTNKTCASFEFLPETGEFRRGESCDQ